MVDPFAGPRLRFDRARSQLEELKRAEAAFLGAEPKPYSCTTRYDATNDLSAFIAHVHREPDPALGLLAAEVIHNLRAGLDNLIWGIADKKLRKDWRLKFPIYDDPLMFVAESYPVLHKLPPPLWAAIEEIQPYNRPNPAETPDPLCKLHEFWNKDKHRAPVACGGAVVAFALPAGYLEEGQPPKVRGGLTDQHRALYEGKEIGWATGIGPDKGPSSVSYFIAFQAEGIEHIYPLFSVDRTHRIITEEIVPTIRAAWDEVNVQGSVSGSP